MKMCSLSAAAAVTAFVLALQFAHPDDEKGKEGGPSVAFSYSKDA